MMQDDTGIDRDTKSTKQDKKVKNWNTTILIVLIIVLIASMANLSIFIGGMQTLDNIKLRYEESTRTERIKHLLDEVDNLYNEYYTGELDYDKIEKMVINGYILGAEDRYGMYLSGKDTTDYYNKINDRLVGIGVEVVYEDESLYVTDVYKDSPADNSGINVGDKIKSIENENVSELGLQGAVDKIKGEQGTRVNISLDNRDLTIERDLVTTSNIRYDIINDIGYIKIKCFTAGTDGLFKDIMNELQNKGIDKFIFDLRGNGGGLLDSVVETLDYLLPKGLIVRIEDRNGTITEFNSDRKYVEGEMVVIVNNETASAAELFTLALMDYNKATVIGTNTYGKGTSTTTIPLSIGSVNISTNLYYTKSGTNIEGVGIKPDIVLEYKSDVPLYRAKYSEDNQLQKALELLDK